MIVLDMFGGDDLFVGEESSSEPESEPKEEKKERVNNRIVIKQVITIDGKIESC